MRDTTLLATLMVLMPSVMAHCGLPHKVPPEAEAISVSTVDSTAYTTLAGSRTTTTLYPTPHWDHDSSDPEHMAPSHIASIYYAPSGNGTANSAHAFQWVNATLNSPAVVLDHSDLVSYTWENSSDTLSIKFNAAEAFSTAQSTWNTSIILVAFVEGCGNYDKGDSCYIVVDSLDFDTASKSCQVIGEVQTLQQCMRSLEASWGQYLPVNDAPMPPDHQSELLSIFSSVVNKYPEQASVLSSYWSASYTGNGIGGPTGLPSVSATPTATHGSPWGFWNKQPVPSPDTVWSSMPTQTYGGDGYGGYSSGSYQSGSAAITTAPTQTTSLSPSMSSISSLLSSYLASQSSSSRMAATRTNIVPGPPSLCKPTPSFLNLFPTACPGPDFDSYLDSVDGYLTLNETHFASLTALFPGVFASFGAQKRGLESDLHKRLDCGDLGFLAGVCDTVTSGIDSLSSDFSDATSTLGSEIVSLASQISQSASELGQEISNDASTAIAELLSAANSLSLSYSLSSQSFGINITPPESAKHQSPWGQQVLIHSFDRNSSDSSSESGSTTTTATSFGLNVFCVDCAITGTVEISGSLTIDDTGIQALTFSAFMPQLQVSLGLGLDAKVDWTRNMDVTLFRQGIPELCAGSTLCIGPYVALDVDFELEIAAQGYLLAGGTWLFNNAAFDIDAVGHSASGSNLTPNFTPNLNAGGEITVTATIGLPLTIGIGLDILDGKFSRDVSLGVVPSLTGTATAAVDVANNGGSTTVNDATANGCNGIEVALDWRIEVIYNLFGFKSGDLYDTGEQLIDRECIAFSSFVPQADNANGQSSTGLGIGSGGGGSPNTFYVNLHNSRNEEEIWTCNDGNVYQVPSGFQSSSCSPTWVAWSIPGNLNSLSSIIIADSQFRVPLWFPSVFAFTQTSRLRMANVDEIPARGEFISFGSSSNFFPGLPRVWKPTTGPFLMTTYACTNVQVSLPGKQVFLAYSYQSAALQNAFSPTAVTNGAVVDCEEVVIAATRATSGRLLE